jgi:hypothetical protein
MPAVQLLHRHADVGLLQEADDLLLRKPLLRVQPIRQFKALNRFATQFRGASTPLPVSLRLGRGTLRMRTVSNYPLHDARRARLCGVEVTELKRTKTGRPIAKIG